MDNLLARIIKVLCICIVVIIVTSFSVFYNDIRSAREITDNDVLSGQRIGVMSGWESDYFLTPRKDLTLKRYDATADLFMALSYKQVDALAIDNCLYCLAESSLSNIKRVGDPLYSFYYTFYTVKESKYLEELNEFIAYYSTTDEYKEFADKAYDLSWILSEDYTPETGTGDVLRIGYVSYYYPNIFANENGEVRGFEREFLVRFANYYNYQIEWHEITEESVALDIKYNKVDVCSCCATDLYRAEVDNSVSRLAMTDGYILSNINLVVTDGNLSINDDFLFDLE